MPKREKESNDNPIIPTIDIFQDFAEQRFVPKDYYSIRSRLRRTIVFIILGSYSGIPGAILFLIIGIFILVVYVTFFSAQLKPSSQLKEYIQSGQIESATVKGNYIWAKHKVEGEFGTRITSSDWEAIWPELISHDVHLSFSNSSSFWEHPFWLFAFLVVIILAWEMRFKTPRLKSEVADLMRSRASLMSNQMKRVTFKDIVVPEKVLDSVNHIIDFLKEPQKYQKLGGRVTKGYLFAGPPGAGKSYMAKAVAGETNVPFFFSSGSEFVEIYPGVGPARVRDLFSQGKKNAPCILFIDDIDIIAKTRSAWPDPALLDYEMTLSQLLIELDGVEANDGVIVIAATNRLDLIDEALIRPGRLFPVLEFGYPTLDELERIFAIKTRKVPLADDIDLEGVASALHRSLHNATGAIVDDVVNRATKIATLGKKKTVDQATFLEAIEETAKLQREINDSRIKSIDEHRLS